MVPRQVVAAPFCGCNGMIQNPSKRRITTDDIANGAPPRSYGPHQQYREFEA